MHDAEGYYYDSNNQKFKELKKIADEKENKLYNKIDQILSPEINGFPNYYNLIERKIAVYDFSGDIQESECLYFTNDNTLNKIAKRIVSRNIYENMDEKTLKHFQDFLKSQLDNRWTVYSHDGSSYDGFFSFTEGYVEAITSFNGYEQMEFDDKFNEKIKYIKECFYSDYQDEYFKDKSFDEALKLIDEDEEINIEYEQYEDDWLADEAGTFFVAVQFYANGNEYKADDWTCKIYAGDGDIYGKRKNYYYESTVGFKEINEPGVINQIESKIKEAISNFDSLN